MLFPSFTFLLGFLPLTVLIYYFLARRSPAVSRAWLIFTSFVFYSWFNWSYALILAGSLMMNWFFARILWEKQSKAILVLGIICNILLLGYFKYYDFFVENINMLFGTSFLLKHILLPLGISFSHSSRFLFFSWSVPAHLRNTLSEPMPCLSASFRS